MGEKGVETDATAAQMPTLRDFGVPDLGGFASVVPDTSSLDAVSKDANLFEQGTTAPSPFPPTT
jgi:hypothetical protein